MRYITYIFFRQKAVIINGKEIADEIQNELKATIQDWINNNRKRPKLVAIKVGNDPASKVYVERKMKAANFIGKITLMFKQLR